MVSEGIFINGEKVTFNPENILNGDISSYTEAIGEATQDWLDEHLEPGGSVPIDDTLTIAGAAADAKAAGDAISELNTHLSHKANTDGSYDTLTAGNAKQLLSNLEQTDMVPYNYRTAGGSLEIGDREKLKKIVGGSLAVNQLALNSGVTTTSNEVTYTNNNDGSWTISGTATGGNAYATLTNHPRLANHVYFLDYGGNISVANQYRIGDFNSGDTINYTKPYAIAKYALNGTITIAVQVYEGKSIDITIAEMIFDLTAMFGTTIADYVYGLETATAGAGVEWLKAHFPKIFDSGYIPYNAGTLEHVSGLSAHKMVGFNQWDEEWELGGIANADGAKYTDNARIRSKNYIPVFPSTTYYFKMPSAYSQFKLVFYDADKTFISYTTKRNETFVTPANCHYMMIAENATDYGTTYNHDICINLHWDGERDGEYEPYEEHSYPLDSDVTLRGIPKLDANNNLYYDGDEYVADGTVTRKYGIVDLGTLGNWMEYSNWPGLFYLNTTPSGAKIPSSNTIVPNCIAPGYLPCRSQIVGTTGYTKGYVALASNRIYVSNDTYTGDTAAFKAAMSGVMLVYELATPTTEEADPYTEIQNVSNWGTEEFVTDALVPVGHETAYQPDLRAKIEVAPESPDTDGLYLMKRENGQNSYVAYLGELPSDPTTDGTYTLKCTVSSGTATKTWEADT